MPELPEVETIRRGLSKRIIGRKIVDIEVRNAKSFIGDKSSAEGQKVEGVERRAKNIQIKLSNGLDLLFHLKMTGQLIYLDKTEHERFAGGHPDHEWHAQFPTKHTHIIFTFDNDSHLYFNDLRKFGWCKVLTIDELQKVFSEFGIEPLDNSSGQASPVFTVEYLQQKAKNIPNRNIKQFLLDQTIIAGIGNIYVDEALFLARIMPTRKVKDISEGDWQNLRQSVVKVLEMGIKYGGTTDSDYVNADGKKGGMQDYLNVYHKTGSLCSGECGGKVERMTIGGRGTHYCPNCQK